MQRMWEACDALQRPARAEMGNTVRFEVKTPREVAIHYENSYAQLNAFDWSN